MFLTNNLCLNKLTDLGLILPRAMFAFKLTMLIQLLQPWIRIYRAFKAKRMKSTTLFRYNSKGGIFHVLSENTIIFRFDKHTDIVCISKSLIAGDSKEKRPERDVAMSLIWTRNLQIEQVRS